MCKFCDDLKWREYKIPYRTCSADDNRCEYGSPDIVNDGENEYILGSTCEDCVPCSEYCTGEGCYDCIVTKVFNEYARITKQI